MVREKTDYEKGIVISNCYKPQLKTKIYQCNGQEFENFFTEVMKLINPNHRNPKPRGSFGDGKCDGFLQETGEYYQCYSPEEIKDKTEYAKNKLKETVKTILEEWNDISPVKKIFFVINDKFQGVDKEVYNKVSELNQENSPIIIKEFLMDDFVKMFFEKLDFNQIQEILSYVPLDEELLQSLDGSTVLEIIRELLKMDEEKIEDKTILAPPIDEKIEYNKLNSEIKRFLDKGYTDIYFLQDYFKKNKDEEETLKSIFMKAYDDSCKQCRSGDEKFFYITQKLCPYKQKIFRKEFFVIISYYFSYCDIFEEPITKLNQKQE